jgi:hypothetical protein
MPKQLFLRQTEPAIFGGHVVGGVLAQKHDVGTAVLVENLDGRRPVVVPVIVDVCVHQ